MPHLSLESPNIPPDAFLKASALQAASPIVVALDECDEDLRKEAIHLFKQLLSGELDAGERMATTSLLAEILFPYADEGGLPGLQIEEAEKTARREHSEDRQILDRMDHEEAVFADRVRTLMLQNEVTQEDLAGRLGIGQPAISMMLQRTCRPQKRTIIRVAEALGVQPEELWPSFK